MDASNALELEMGKIERDGRCSGDWAVLWLLIRR